VPLPLDATSFENGYHLTEELACSAVGEDEGSQSCVTWISHTFHMQPPGQISIHTWHKTFKQKRCNC